MHTAYIVPSGEWDELKNRIEIKRTDELDQRIRDRIKQFVGLGKMDCGINMHRPESKCGAGITSFTDRRLCGIARELDVALADSGGIECSIRNSIELTAQITTDMVPEDFERAIPTFIRQLSQYGFYLRDMADPIMSITMEILLKKRRRRKDELGQRKSLHPIGTLHYNGQGRTSTGIGTGDKQLQNVQIHGKHHKELTAHRDEFFKSGGSWKDLGDSRNWRGNIKLPAGINTKALGDTVKEVKETLTKGVTTSHDYHE